MKKILLASLALSPLYLTTQSIHAEKFTLAIMGDTQYNWSCKDEDKNYANSKGKPNDKYADYCNTEAKQKNEAEDSNNKAIDEINRLKNNKDNNYKGLIINGDLTAFGHPEEREKFQKFYNIKDYKTMIYPALGNHDYQNNVNDCGGLPYSLPTWNRCAGGMMHLMADWILGYKGLDKGKAHGCNPLLKSCDIYAFNKNPAQAGGNRNVIGSLAYSWEIDKFLFIQLQNYPHYTKNFKRGYKSGVSSWTMKAQNSMDWLTTQLKEAQANKKYVILNLHNIAYYFDNNDNSIKDKAELEKVLQEYSPNIRAIFVGHYHQEIGLSSYHQAIGGVPIIYSGSPISGRFLKVEFNRSAPESCISVNKVTTTKDGIESLKKISCPALN